MKDYYDIINWKAGLGKFLENFNPSSSSNSKIKSKDLKIDIPKLYSLLKLKISNVPNGLYTEHQKGMPMDNIFWWDFIFESEVGFIQIWRSNSFIQSFYCVNDDGFDIDKFLNLNINQYYNEINAELKKFEKHIIYINHYKSYKECVLYLWSEIKELDLSLPSKLNSHYGTKEEIDSIYSETKTFTKNSIKFHALGKSLLLNLAFMVESFLNLIIRIGIKNEAKSYPDIQKKHLNDSFIQKLKSLKYHSQIIENDVNIEAQEIKGVLELMTVRNKYVHFDMNSDHNKIDEVLFDGDYPLHNLKDHIYTITYLQNIYHNPNFLLIERSFQASFSFIEYIISLISFKYRHSILLMCNENPIGYNENKQIFSSVVKENLGDFYMTIESKSD